MTVVVMIADLVRSRVIPDRADFQRRLAGSLQELDVLAGSELLSPGTITLGDEFQALFRSFHGILPWLPVLLSRIAPVAARFALAAGPLSTDINPKAALAMDGPAFIAARELLTRLKSQRRTVIQATGVGRPAPALANAALSLLAGMMEGWKPGTHAILGRLASGQSVDEIAQGLGLSTRGVYKHQAGRHLPEVRRLLQQAAQDLDERFLACPDDGERP
ncbi:MAG: SatD family protein [bacterium]|jgi:hypothetical protein|nr:SatD family protein [bacterium]